MPFYYPNWINDFWRIMGLIHFGDRDRFCIPAEKRFDEAARREFCSREGLAFYDPACEVRRLRGNASDAFLEVVTPTDIPVLLERIPECKALVTTGQKATEVISERFCCAVPPIGGYIDISLDERPAAVAGINCSSGNPAASARRLRFWRMPSTSRAYPLPLQQKAEYYSRLWIGVQSLDR